MVFFNKEYKVYDLRQYGLKGLYFDLVSAIDFMYCAVDHGEKILGGALLYWKVKIISNQTIIGIAKKKHLKNL